MEGKSKDHAKYLIQFTPERLNVISDQLTLLFNNATALSVPFKCPLNDGFLNIMIHFKARLEIQFLDLGFMLLSFKKALTLEFIAIKEVLEVNVQRADTLDLWPVHAKLVSTSKHCLQVAFWTFRTKPGERESSKNN